MTSSGYGPIRIKPHHLVDIISALGAGPPVLGPSPYGHALHTVTVRVLEDPDALVLIELGADDICAPCMHNVSGRCDDAIDTSYRPAAPTSKGAYNLLVDRRWCDRMQLRQGDTLTVRGFCERLLASVGDISGVYREEAGSYIVDKARDIRTGVGRLLPVAD